MSDLTDVVLPEMGENIETVSVATVLVAVGDTVERDQPILEVETEKASAEVPSPVAGTVREVLVASGDSARVGQTIARIAAGATETVAATAERTATTEAPAPPKSSRSVLPAEHVPPTPDPLPPASPTDYNPVSAAEARAAKVAELGEPAPAAPSVRRLARELGIDVHEVADSGPRGRITADDVKAHAKGLLRGGAAAPAPAPVAHASMPLPTLPDFSAYGETERRPITQIRRATALNMARAWATVPHVTQHDRADITALEAFRKKYGDRVARAGGKLTVTAIAVNIAAAALRRFETFNASLDLAAQEVVLKKFVHVGVAVDTPRGLLVPVVRDADRKSVAAIATELGDLAARAREKKIRPDELGGATFTITNLGSLGTTDFSPIVNWPEVAILGLGRGSIQPVWDGSEFVPRTLLPLSLSYDHRIIDGADAARFLRWVAEALEQPLLLALED